MSHTLTALAVAGVLQAIAATGGGARVESAATERSRASVVEIAVVGNDAAYRFARSLVGARGLGGRPTTWTWLPRFSRPALPPAAPDDPTASSARVWLDLSEAGRARLTFAAPAATRFLFRDVELSGRFDAIDRESLAEVLELSVSALGDETAVGLSRAEAETVLLERQRDNAPQPNGGVPPARAPATPAAAPAHERMQPPILVVAPAIPTTAPTLSFRLAMTYAVQAQASTLPFLHGPGFVVALERTAIRWRMGAWVSGQFLWSSPERATDLGVRLQTVATRAGLEAVRPWGASPSAGSDAPFLRARLGAGVDRVHITPLAGERDATLTATRWSTSLAAQASVAGALALGARAYLALNVLVDLLPTAVDYTEQVGGGAAPVFSTWHLRPGVAIELGL